MPISSYSSIRDNNAAIVPGNIRHKDFEIQQIINAIRQLMADLAGFSGGADPVTVGIQFPAVQVPSANPNTLDDYEEGTWTPAYGTTGVAFTSVTHDLALPSYYTKIGRFVQISGFIRTDAITIGPATGGVTITGIPFGSAAAGFPVIIGFSSGFLTAAPSSGVLFTTTISLYIRVSGTNNSTALPVANMQNAANVNEIYFSLVYNV